MRLTIDYHSGAMTQAEALAIMKTGRNIFLTGEPGAGKSYTVREYVKYLRSCGLEPAITASTGIAATHIGGMTLHSWSGIGIAKSLLPSQIREIAGKDKVAKRIKNTSVLIIDEISMFDGATLSLVEAVCRGVRENTSPFGGLQVIFVGDFFQLPPVSRPGEAPVEFAFMSPAWLAAEPTICYLSEQHRQDDPTFLEVLAAVRRGRVTSEHRDLLSSRQAEFMDDMEHEGMTKLYSHNADVDRMNMFALSKIEATARTFPMTSHGAPPLIEQLKRGCLSPEMLVLKTGAWVMFTKNSQDGAYVNGTTGEIAGFSKTTGNPIVKTRSGRQIEAELTTWKIEIDGKILASISQIPLRLAWAMTVHKSQGMSLDAALIDLSSAFAYGQGYVALSRVRSFSGLHLRGLNERALQVDPIVLASDAQFREQSQQAQSWLDTVVPQELATSHEYFVASQGGRVKGHEGVKGVDGVRGVKGVRKERRYVQTLELVKTGLTIAQVAAERGRSTLTIIEHLEELRGLDKLPHGDIKHLIAGQEEDVELIQDILKRQPDEFLKPVFEKFQGEYSYDLIRLARLFLPKSPK